MEFNNPEPKTKEELELNFASNDVDLIAESLVSLSLYEKDWYWAQNICLYFLDSDNPIISGLAATSLGHIARIHHNLDKQKVLLALEQKVNDPAIRGRVQDALDDIEIYSQ
ncbi:hypothetical protein RHO14_07200 [Orbus wheelerorum]|uniref:hypothetical protein n=1 Tax=Orbus wheelerorum TaxID=3074111 RepID=UPI00370DD306